MKVIPFAFLLSLAFVADAGIDTISYPTEVFSTDVACPVQKVIDGDTAVILYDGAPTTVRLIGVDTPETMHPTKPIEAFGKEASAFTRNLLLGESVYLRFDDQRTDKYDRLLAYFYRAPDGLFVNLEIVRQGYGHAYTRFPFKYMQLFQHYERQARDAGKGLWDGTTASRPTLASKQQQPDRKEAVNDEMEVYTTISGTKYHLKDCRHLRRSQKAISLKDARKRYAPCSVCKPPK